MINWILSFLLDSIITKEDTTKKDLKKDLEKTQMEDQETYLADKEDNHPQEATPKTQTDSAGKIKNRIILKKQKFLKK